MDIYHFVKSSLKDSLVTIVIGVAAFVVVLATTLNLTTASIVLLLFLAAMIFQKSFSRGWLFMLSVIVLLPTMKIDGELFVVHDMFLVALSVIGLLMIIIENYKLPLIKISYQVFLIELIGISTLVFAIIFGQQIDQLIVLVMFMLGLYWISTTIFQHYFRTMKRLKRFFILIIFIASVHSLFGLISFIFGFQTSTGLGVTNGKINFLFLENIKYQINGFLGNGYALRIGFSALAPLFLITIPLSLAWFSTKEKKKKIIRPLKKIEKTAKILEQGFYRRKNILTSLKAKIKTKSFEKIKNSKTAVVIFLLIQVLGLIFTFSYTSLVILTIGLFVMAILFRNKKFISLIVAMMILMTIVIPGTFPSASVESQNNVAQLLSSWDEIRDSFVWGSGWRVDTQGSNKVNWISNSYILIWAHFGILGIAVFGVILWKYFMELYNNYRKSDGEKRIWLVAILAIFVEFLFLGLVSNSYVFGPAALIFWLLYGATGNLAMREIVFGLTETKYIDSWNN